VRLAYLLALIVVGGCSESTIGQPAGDNNYDDPDDPGNPGENSSAPDASGDAYGRFCVAARDCPADMVCAYPIADLCGAAGRCLPYDASDVGCDAGLACGCDGTEVAMCAPEGYAPKPISSTSPCDGGVPDASTPDASTNDASTDDAGEDGSNDDAGDGATE